MLKVRTPVQTTLIKKIKTVKQDGLVDKRKMNCLSNRFVHI